VLLSTAVVQYAVPSRLFFLFLRNATFKWLKRPWHGSTRQKVTIQQAWTGPGGVAAEESRVGDAKLRA
jgi:hypothetical protein